MALTGQQIKQLQQALLDAFPSKALLEMMVRIELDEQLDAIAYGDNQTVIVYKLITWAERTGSVRAMIAGAAAANGRNPLMAKLVNDSRSWVFDIPVVPAALEPLAAPPPVALPSARAQTPAGPIAFDWVIIPAGDFLMGSDKTKDKLAWDDETPQHTLHLPEYRIARFPVTVAQFAAFMAANPGYRTAAELQGSTWTGSEWKEIEGPIGRTRGAEERCAGEAGPSCHLRLVARRARVLKVGRRAAAVRGGVGEGRSRHGWPYLALGRSGAEQQAVQLQHARG